MAPVDVTPKMSTACSIFLSEINIVIKCSYNRLLFIKESHSSFAMYA